MKYIKGKLLDGDNVIAEDINILLNEIQAIPKSWEGRFESFPDANFKSGKVFKLVLEDGRSGNVFLTRITFQSVVFEGSGPLE